MGFIENRREQQAAITNGWLDEQGRVTAEFAEVGRVAPALADPNRPVADVLRDARRRKEDSDD